MYATAKLTISQLLSFQQEYLSSFPIFFYAALFGRNRVGQAGRW
jgi:hypothetical protein